MWLLLLGIGAVGAGFAVASHRRGRHRHDAAPPPTPAGVKEDGTPCDCVCHRMPGVVHVMACCAPGEAGTFRELPSFSPNRGHYGYYDDSGNYRRG